MPHLAYRCWLRAVLGFRDGHQDHQEVLDCLEYHGNPHFLVGLLDDQGDHEDVLDDDLDEGDEGPQLTFDQGDSDAHLAGRRPWCRQMGRLDRLLEALAEGNGPDEETGLWGPQALFESTDHLVVPVISAAAHACLVLSALLGRFLGFFPGTLVQELPLFRETFSAFCSYSRRAGHASSVPETLDSNLAADPAGEVDKAGAVALDDSTILLRLKGLPEASWHQKVVEPKEKAPVMLMVPLFPRVVAHQNLPLVVNVQPVKGKHPKTSIILQWSKITTDVDCFR